MPTYYQSKLFENLESAAGSIGRFSSMQFLAKGWVA